MKKAKLIILLALLIKVMEQLDSIILSNPETQVKHWKSQIFTIFEDVQDKIKEIEEGV